MSTATLQQTASEPSETQQAPDSAPPATAGALFVKIVVPVRNEAPFIEATLTQLLAQDYPEDRYEIVVVDGQSTDATPDLVAQMADSHPNIRLLSNPQELSSAARNIGVRAARGEVVLVVDGHCEIASDKYLRNLAAAFERSGAECIGRPQPLDVSHATTLQQAIAAARTSRLGHHPDSHIYSSQEGFVPAKSVAVAYRRSVFDTVGYFDEAFDACEDFEFNYRIDRAGLRCYFTPEVAVHYVPRDSLRGLFRQLVRYGRGRIKLWRKHPESFSWGVLPPSCFVAGLVAGPPLSLLSEWLAGLYCLALVIYAVLLSTASAAIALRQRRSQLLLWVPLVFLTVHVGSGTGLLFEIFRPTRHK